MSRIEVVNARSEDRDAVIALLESNGLPTSDLDAARFASMFLVAKSGAELLSSVAIERFGDAALLRSLVVAPTQRGTGLGRALTSEAENHAAAAGVRQLWLLTASAASFFERQGYSVASREDAPVVIASTPQFSSLCPSTARLMRKALA